MPVAHKKTVATTRISSVDLDRAVVTADSWWGRRPGRGPAGCICIPACCDHRSGWSGLRRRARDRQDDAVDLRPAPVGPTRAKNSTSEKSASAGSR